MIQDGRQRPPVPGSEGEGREPLLYFFGEAAGREAPIEEATARALRLLGADPGTRILVALSGGADSTALLALLAELGDLPLVVCHVDHGLRAEEELARERALVEETCARLGLRLRVERLGRGRVASRAARRGSGLEAAARELRYGALRAAAIEEGAPLVALAHTLDDQLETLLMRCLGGAGTAGLRGIPARRGPFVRPLVGRSKSELLAYLDRRGLAWSEDSSNAEGLFLRNRVRRELVPLLDRIAPTWRGGLLAMARGAVEDEAALAGLAPAFEPVAGGLEIEAEVLRLAPPALGRRALLDALGRLGPAASGPRGAAPEGSARVPRSLVDGLLAAAARGARAEAFGLVAATAGRDGGERFRLERRLDFPRRRGYFVRVGGAGRFSTGFGRRAFVVRAEWSDGGPGLREGTFSFPLALRTRLPGDRLRTALGHKALDELVAERGLPPDRRDQVPVLEDAEGIVAVLFSAIGAGPDRRRQDSNPPRPGLRFLRIRLKGAAKASWTSTTRTPLPSGDSSPEGPKGLRAAAKPPSRSSSPSAS